jgi:4-carboxymuconolactone decarboxylase
MTAKPQARSGPSAGITPCPPQVGQVDHEADAIVIELGREIFGARKVASATFARSLRQFGRRALVDLVALMGNYAGTAALLTAFDMQLDLDQPPLLPPP